MKARKTRPPQGRLEHLFVRFANATARISGSPQAFLLCVVVVIAWAACGPFFHYSETWQLVINTGTTIVTFLMVFLIQNTQNRGGAAVQTKLDELIRSSDAQNDFMGIERLTDGELDELHVQCEAAARKAEQILARAQAERASRIGIGAAAKPKPAGSPRRTAAARTPAAE